MGRVKLFLHAGAPKTGTSTVQQFMVRNRELLRARGVAFPRFTNSTNGHHALAEHYRHAPIAWTESKPKSELLHIIEQSVRKTPDCHAVLLSSEAFWGIKAQVEQLRTDLADYDVTFIVYLRRQDDFLEANYRQKLKMGMDVGSPEKFYRDWGDTLDYRSKLACWEEAFGRENLIVRPYDPKSWTLRLEDQFLDLLGLRLLSLFAFEGLPDTPGFRYRPRKNPSLGIAALRYIRATRDTIDYRSPYRKRVIQGLTLYSAEFDADSSRSRIYSNAIRTEFMETLASDNEYISERYGLPKTGFFDVADHHVPVDKSFAQPLDDELRQQIDDFLEVFQSVPDKTSEAA